MKELADVLKEILAVVEPKAVALFGSHARGEAGKLSDLDVLVITRSEEDAEKLRLLEKVLQKKFRNVELHVLPINAALELVHRRDPFFIRVLNECRPVCGSFYLGFLREVAANVGKSKGMA